MAAGISSHSVTAAEVIANLLQRQHSAFAEELSLGIEIALAAGDIALRYHGSDLQIETKPGNEPVTIADRLCSEYIVRELERAFPTDAVVSEEIENSEERLHRRRVWYVDPIDGTKDFIRGANTYCIMIGLTVEHIPKLGILYQPNSKTLVIASHQGGAWSIHGGNAKRLRVSPVNDMAIARLFSRKVAQSAEFRDILGIHGADRIGSIGMKMCALAAGASDIYVNPYTNCSSWDTCAPQVIVQEAGGKMSDRFGKPLCFDNPNTMHHKYGLIATASGVHEAVVAKLASLYPRLQ